MSVKNLRHLIWEKRLNRSTFETRVFHRPKGACVANWQGDGYRVIVDFGHINLDKVENFDPRDRFNVRVLNFNVRMLNDDHIHWTDFLFENYWDAYAYYLKYVKEFSKGEQNE